jgi:hypothetical protein
MRKSVMFLSVFLNVCTFPSTARADPLTLSGLSYFALDFEGDFFHFVGKSFGLSGRTEFGVAIPRVHASSCEACFPGDVVNLSFRTTGVVDLGNGQGTIDGVIFPSLTFRGSLQFDVTPVAFPDVPPGHLGGLSIDAPFRFSGLLHAFEGKNEVFARALRGVGVAGTSFAPASSSSGDGPPFTFAEDQWSFRFEEATPVPEPSTMMLVGLGTLLLSRLRQSRRLRPPTLRNLSQ